MTFTHSYIITWLLMTSCDNTTPGFAFYAGATSLDAGSGTRLGEWTPSGVNTTGVFKVGGTKVVGAQGAAVANATDAASAITQLNTLLARLRTHGLIAT